MENDLLGLPLEAALSLLDAQGKARPQIEYTHPPRGGQEGTPRVVRQREGLLTAACFPDRVKEEE